MAQTLDAARALGLLPEGTSIRLDRGLIPDISEKGKPAPVAATGRWIVERTNSWHDTHKKLVWCTERRGRVIDVIDFWVAFSNAVIIVGRLVREAWSRYRWDGRPLRRP